MRKLAKTPLAGMLGAIPILALSCGAATSQTPPSQVLNNQVQFGDVFADQTLDVVSVNQTVGVSAATGNAVTSGSAGRDMDVTSYQELQGSVEGQGVVKAAEYMGETATITTAASGNTADITAYAATVTAVQTQVTGPTAIVAESFVDAPNAAVIDMNYATQAAANSQTIGLSNSALGARVSQWNEADVLANGGAVVGGTRGQATTSAVAAANNLNSGGANQSAQRIIATQGSNGASVEATVFSSYGQTYVANTNASATANNIVISNEGPLLDVTTDQSNVAAVRAQSEAASDVFSTQAATAYGAGNSVMAGNFGAEVVLDNAQFNGGGVEVNAISDGNYGWDNTASASAVGNAVTGYACSTCSSRMTITNSQTNDAAVTAGSYTRVGNGRSATAISSAVGNTASFYVTSPGGAQ